MSKLATSFRVISAWAETGSGACTMSGRTILGSACALAISLGSFTPSLAQSNLRPIPPTSAAAGDDWQKDVTVLTIAPDGTWGAATDGSISRAIANAIGDCKSRYQREIGCGYQLTSVRAGWSLGIRSGNQNIIVAARTLVEAEQAAINREVELRQVYVPDMPPCIRVVSVDPQGAITAPNVADFVGMVMNRRSGSP
jgi:hypothetical protein